ncbi:DUF3857 domain-containing protein [Lutibacter sp. B1]|uniref:DUF3857 domain-containing protein n=1 Tax=Lutibacter sp. B1 TaxID=2725996 RepID=UPI0014563C31|nr:DUF3857 domain-containing protein [Lutibacter sp. B1]NLP58729.1 DUF3857 and transglutaminase domain-containing protein [Lutibacter sp. B1]
MKKIATLLILLLVLNSYSQNKTNYTFGEISQEELNLKRYELDTTANALVLFESGNSFFELKNRRIYIYTKFYKKIKIFNSEGFEYATFRIPLYNNKENKENIIGIKAVTHNNLNKTFLKKSDIFEERVTENWRETKFTMPNINEGSIIEVEYTLETPFKFNLTGWEFQSEIPKLVSNYKALIPGNYFYNRSLNGYLKLTKNSSSITKKCFEVPGIGYADCENVSYGMKNIPAFKNDEEYMTSKDNFISKMKFELSEMKQFDGSIEKYTTTWEAVDKEFKENKNVGGQFKKTNFFKKQLPNDIKSITSDLDKAKAVYYFIQNNFAWNGKYNIFKNIDVVDAYKNKSGNVGEINIALINALNASGLNTELMLISTRDNGFPTKIHPVISDFNYIIAKVNIDNTFYLLDATDKETPFSIVPFKCLNSYGRVFDFKNDSYWLDITPNNSSQSKLTVDLKLDENGSISGKLRKLYKGYDAINRRKSILNKKNDEIISDFESNFNNLEVIDYSLENKLDIEKPLIEVFEISMEDINNNNTIYLNPFFDERYKINPFKQEERSYPVDFGYPRKSFVLFHIEIPDNYSIESIPESIKVKLEKEEDGNFNLLTKQENNSKIQLISSLNINKPLFYDFQYQTLKELFNQVIIKQKTPILLKKK